MSSTVERKKESQKKTLFKCDLCGQQFNKTRSWNRFCSRSCRFKAWDKAHPRIKQGV